MIGDIVNFKEEYLITSKSIINKMDIENRLKSQEKFVIVIAGESGTGKTVTSYCLQKCLDDIGISSYILYQDDYFFHPPLSNHLLRMQSLENVGMQEVNLELIQLHMEAFRNNEEKLVKPLVYYNENTISEELIHLRDFQVLIVEGTYCLSLTGYDEGVFMDRDYIQTKKQRVERGRDEQTDFIEKVLEIEHKIIRPFKKKARILIDTDYNVIENTSFS